MTFKSILSSKNSSNNKIKSSNNNMKKSRNSSMLISEPENSFSNVLAEKVVNISEIKQSERACASLDMDVVENIKESEPQMIFSTHSSLLKELLKKPLSLFKTHASPVNKSGKSSKQLERNQRFLVDSRINRRLHEKFVVFLSIVKKSDNSICGNVEEKTQVIMGDPYQWRP